MLHRLPISLAQEEGQLLSSHMKTSETEYTNVQSSPPSERKLKKEERNLSWLCKKKVRIGKAGIPEEWA